MWSSPLSHSWSEAWNSNFTDSHWSSTGDPSFSHANTWHASWTWSSTWTSRWHTSWASTWSRHTQIYPTYTWTQDGSGCDPNDPYCNGYYPPGYVPPQTPNPWCYADNQYCNVYAPAQTVITVTASPSTPQTVFVTQPMTQTITQTMSQTVLVTQPAPQTTGVIQPESLDYAIIAFIAIIAAAAIGMLLVSRKPGAAPSTQSTLQFCTTCGRQTPLNSRFCGQCGSAQ